MRQIQAGLEVLLVLLLPPKCWDCRCVPLSLALPSDLRQKDFCEFEAGLNSIVPDQSDLQNETVSDTKSQRGCAILTG